MRTASDYVLITPAKNEATTVGLTIASVTAQIVPPAEWVIVSDGSTDDTDNIVTRSAQRHPWIRLLRLPLREKRSFAAVVFATEKGIRALTTTNYRYIGLLDADVSFEPAYFATLLDRFDHNPKLGLGGGVVFDIGTAKTRLPRNRLDVPGAVQFFRRECFESLGRLLAIPEGGWDALTCAQARMNGFETALFIDLVVDHHKPRNVSQGGVLKRAWQLGLRDYALGYHPLFEFAKCATRLREKPRIIGALAWCGGFCRAYAQRRKRLLPTDLLAFVRAEQLQRLGLRAGSQWDRTRRQA